MIVASAGNIGQDLLGRKIYGGIKSPGIEPSVITVGASNTFFYGSALMTKWSGISRLGTLLGDGTSLSDGTILSDRIQGLNVLVNGDNTPGIPVITDDGSIMD